MCQHALSQLLHLTYSTHPLVRTVPSDVFGADPTTGWPEASDATIAGEAVEVSGAAGPHTRVPNLHIARRTYNAVRNLTVDWLGDGEGLWLPALGGQASSNPFHWFSQVVGPLYAAQRANASAGWGANAWDGFLVQNR